MKADLAGALREAVRVERPDMGRDDLGGTQNIWHDMGVDWAAILPGRSGAMVAGDAVQAMPIWRVIMRLRTDIMPGWRLIWRGAVLRVHGVEHDPRTPDRMTLMAVAGG